MSIVSGPEHDRVIDATDDDDDTDGRSSRQFRERLASLAHQAAASSGSANPAAESAVQIQQNKSRSGSLFSSGRRFIQKRASFVSNPNRSIRRYFTRDVIPHVDNYRSRMSFTKGI